MGDIDVDEDLWFGSIDRSEIDPKVWVAVIPDEDMITGAMAASTSLRKCKAHIEAVSKLRMGVTEFRWDKQDDGSWLCFEAAEDG